MSILSEIDSPQLPLLKLWNIGRHIDKQANVKLSGILQQLKSGHLFLSVPTPFIRGVFDSLSEPGISLPYHTPDESLKTGIIVMSPAEVAEIGGSSKITERGQQFQYALGKLIDMPTPKKSGISHCWCFTVNAPELKALRRSYGLSPEPEHGFLIEIAHRRTGVLYSNDTSKVNVQPASRKISWLDQD